MESDSCAISWDEFAFNGASNGLGRNILHIYIIWKVSSNWIETH